MASLNQNAVNHMEGENIMDSSEALTKDTGNSIESSSLFYSNIFSEIFSSPLNLAMLSITCFLLYKIVRDRNEVPRDGVKKELESTLPKLRRDFTVRELRHFDGKQADGRVLVAVNGNIYDVSKGRRFYGPDGPYATFAGRDASRNLAKFNVISNEKDDYDDLSDLSSMEMDSVREWELQFKEKYDLVGKLLRNGEKPTIYDDEEDDDNAVNCTDDNTSRTAMDHILNDSKCNT